MNKDKKDVFGKPRELDKGFQPPKTKSWSVVKDCTDCVKSRLKSELSWLRRKGAIKVGQDDPAVRSCGRCQTELGLLINRGAICSSCRQRVCKECRKYGNYGRDWVCVVCSKQIEIQLASGEWINEFVRRPSRRRDKNFVTPSEGLRSTLVRRSWSISSPTTSAYHVKEEEEIVKQKPPLKPPRKSLTTDENVPPWEDHIPNKPPRRYSMSSFDGISARRQSDRINSIATQGVKSPVNQYTSNVDQEKNIYRRDWPSKAPAQQEINKRYYCGNYLNPAEKERASTLPRRPHIPKRPYSADLTNEDHNRFHSIPRNRGPRSPSGPRGRSEPAPLRENFNALSFISSGPVTSTLIVPLISSMPPTRSNSFTKINNISQDDSKLQTRRNFEPLKNLGRANSSNDFWALTGRGAPGEVKLRDDEGGGVLPQFRRLQVSPKEHQPFDSGVSESSVRPTSDISDEGRPSPIGQRNSRVLLPRSNTSVASGFAPTGRPIGKPSQTNVRRCKSFQAGSPRRNPEDELSLSLRKSSGGQVAKFIQEFEKGIQQTFVNMRLKRSSDSFKETSCGSSRNLFTGSRSPSREDRPADRNSDLSISDDVFEPQKKAPAGGDYKLVFISPDSSKGSEFNSSIDSDNSLRRHFNTTDLKNRSSKFTNLTNTIKWRPNSVSKSNQVDACVNTEGEYISSDYSATDGEDYSSIDSTTAPYPLGIVIPSDSNEKFPKQIIEKAVKCSEIETNYISRKQPLTTLDALHPNELELMLQQTEVVQAEAQALQKALMGAFDTGEIKAPATCWLTQKGFLRDFSSQKCPEGVSPEGHVTLSTDRISRGSQDNHFLQSSNNYTGNFTHKEEEEHKIEEGVCKENIYENVDSYHVQLKPVKECKNVCIQTDIEPLSCDEDDSYETADYSDASYDSVSERGVPTPSDHKSTSSHLLCNPGNSSLDFGNMKIGQYECTKGKGQESAIPPSSSYLSNSPLLSPTHQTPPVHLHLASDCDLTSVSRSAECESGSEKLSVIHGRLSGAASIPKLNENASAKSNYSAIYQCDQNINYSVRKVERDIQDGSIVAARARAFNNGPSSQSPENYPCLTSGGRDNPPHSLPVSAVIQNTSNMSQVKNEVASEFVTHSDVNAAEELISSGKVMVIADSLLNDDGLPSSGTSEGEDTDEEIHVSRSYNVSSVIKDEDENASTNSEKIKLDSSLSDSETDDEKQIIRKYDVTMVSSDSENEEIRNAKENMGAEEGDDVIGDLIIQADSTNSNLVDENILINCENTASVSDEYNELGNINCETQSNFIANNNNELLLNDSIENETTDLPECDQAIGGSTLSENSDINLMEENYKMEMDDKSSDKGDNDLSESIIENKSETESNLGDVTESNKDLIEVDEGDSFSKDSECDGDHQSKEVSLNEEYVSEAIKESVADAVSSPLKLDCIETNDIEKDVSNGNSIEITDTNMGEEADTQLNCSKSAADIQSDKPASSVNALETEIITKNEYLDDKNDNECNSVKCSQTNVDNSIQTCADSVQDIIDKPIDCSSDNSEETSCDSNFVFNSGDQNSTSNIQLSDTIEINNSTVNDIFDTVSSEELSLAFESDDNDKVESSSEVETIKNSENNLEICCLEHSNLKDADIVEESQTDSMLHFKDNKSSEECKSTEITGSVEVEQGSGNCTDKAVTLGVLSGKHELTADSSFVETFASANVNEIASGCDNCDVQKINEGDKQNQNLISEFKKSSYSSESGHSSGEESEGETKAPSNIVKINVVEKNHGDTNSKCNDIFEGGMPDILGDATTVGDSRVTNKRLKQTADFSKSFIPTAPLRKAKKSSSSDGLSSSSDIDRSDADASDSADTVIDNTSLQAKIVNAIRKKKLIDEANRDSDGPSSADSVLQGADSESQCSDGSEEGNLVTIVAVGEDTIPRHSSHGKIYIRSDSTDSDVQIKPTCIVVTGSSGVESGDDGDNEEQQARRKKNKTRNDITILEVTSEHRKDHVMSVRVTSPESSRSTSPARKSNVSELQSMILTHRERQQQFRRSPVETIETSSLTNYFTVTLGTDSPHTHRRVNKTPEVRKRKVPDRSENNDSTSSTPTLAVTPTPTLTPSPTHTPSPAVTPTPDHSEGDLLAYEENHVGIMDDPFAKESPFEICETFDEFYGDGNYDEHYETFVDASAVTDEGDGTFDSIEDAESIGESNYSETSSEEGYEREEELRGYCKRGYDFTLHTIIEESCEESDYDKKTQEEDNSKRDQSELEKYFFFGLGNGQTDSKKYANEESEYSDTFSETSSSNFSEGMESLEGNCENDMDPEELASSRLEKYFSGFLGFERQPSIRSVGEESEINSDESDSVGSDSEGSPSPEQPRKKLFRSRGVRSVSSNRSHGYSSDRCEGIFSDGSLHSVDGEEERNVLSGEDDMTTESEETAFDKGDGQFDTIKRRKKKKILSDSEKKSDNEKADAKQAFSECKLEDAFIKKTEVGMAAHERDSPTQKLSTDELGSQVDKNDIMEGDLTARKYQSRDSGFIGSSDDLLKDKPEDLINKEMESKEKSKSFSDDYQSKKLMENEELKSINKNKEIAPSKCLNNDNNNNKSENEERSSNEGKVSRSSTGSSMDLPAYSQSKGSHNLSRKDSFNNWSSDEETNIMMNKMRIFFKNMFSSVGKEVQKGQKIKSPQLVMFEAKLTNLMRCVPGINDEQVKEIVEYLSSEDTWSDSYDSSDYTSSDLEGPYARLDQTDPELKSELQEQISASCQQIIKKFDQCRETTDSDNMHFFFGGRAYSESSEDASLVSKDTAFLCQKIMSSISNMKPDSDRGSIGSGSQSTSPPLLMKVMHHIGDRIVALMHEVSGGSDIGDDVDSFNGGNPVTSSPRQKLFLPNKHSSADAISFDSSIDKSSLASTSFESEDSPTDTEQSPESDTGTPKIYRRQKLSIISERSSAEDFTSFDSQRTVFSHNEPLQHYIKNDTSKSQSSHGQSYYNPEARGRWHIVSIDADKFEGRDHIGVPKMTKSSRKADPRKAKSHLNLEKIHHEDVKSTGERSESLGDLLDRVRSSSEFSSSYEQLDSDSTLKASDSLDRQIGSSSSNIRLNASSRGSLTTSSRGSLAASSRGSLNASSRGSLQGSSGPEEEEDRKSKKLSFFRSARRSSVPDASKDTPSQEVRSTTLPRSTQPQILTTGTLPRSQSSQEPKSHSSSGLLTTHATYSPAERPSGYHTTGPRSARYHPPGYRPPPAGMIPKRAFSTPSLRKDPLWHISDESGGCVDDVISASSSAITSASPGSLSRAPPPPSRLNRMGGGFSSNASSRAASPFGGSLGKTSGNESVGGSLASFDNSPDEDEARRRDQTDTTKSPLIALGPKSRSESLASVCSTGGEGRFGTVPVQGEILVAFQYNYKEGHLECHVIQCRELAPVDTKRNRSDPYVKAYLLPDKSKNGKRKTKVKRHSLSPMFEEIFKFVTTLGELESRTLWLSVWHSDMFGRNVFLGEVLIPLSDAVFEDSSPKWHSLVDRIEPLEDMNYGAVLVVALKFVPPDVLASTSVGGSRKSKKSRGALLVRVKEASGLIGPRGQNLPDPICKGTLLPEKGKSYKQKTNVVRKTNNPRWNHTMSFDDVTLQELTEKSLELSIWDHDRFGSSEFIGGCRLNLGKGHHNSKIVDWLDASGLEQKLWEQMLERPNLWVESSMLLRPNIDRPIYSSAFTD